MSSKFEIKYKTTENDISFLHTNNALLKQLSITNQPTLVNRYRMSFFHKVKKPILHGYKLKQDICRDTKYQPPDIPNFILATYK